MMIGDCGYQDHCVGVHLGPEAPGQLWKGQEMFTQAGRSSYSVSFLRIPSPEKGAPSGNYNQSSPSLWEIW